MAEPSETGWLVDTAGGFRLHIRLTPKAALDDVDGAAITDDGRCYLKARVRAVPEKGKANRALIALIAKQCGIAKSHIRLVSGETSRLKTLEIEGREGLLRQRLMDLAAQPPKR